VTLAGTLNLRWLSNFPVNTEPLAFLFVRYGGGRSGSFVANMPGVGNANLNESIVYNDAEQFVADVTSIP